MCFIGRQEELAALEREFKRDSSFVVIYGRRRVGKTTLIKEFIKDKNALYYLATEELEFSGRKRLVAAVADYTGQDYISKATFSNWEDIFKVFVEYRPGEKKVIVIDEFQYLVQTNPAFSSIFQNIWDEILKDKQVMVILCGSLVSLMTKAVLSYSSPLYGRRTAQIKLAPLKFSELEQYYKQFSFKELVDLYALTGGVPKYIEFFANDQPLLENIRTNILNKAGYLYEEPLFLLAKEVREPVTYFSIIETIAAGKHKIGEIAAALELKTNSLSPYLKTLTELNLVEKRIPVTETAPHKSRKGLFFISDSFIRFWFTFIYPYKGELEIGNLKPALKRFEEHYIDNFLSYVFENISREQFNDFCRIEAIDFNPTKTGAYWDGRQGNEIDLVAIDETKGQIFFGECKYTLKRPVGLKTYAALQTKAKAAVFASYTHRFILFSVSGFEQRLLEIASENKDLVLANDGIIV